MSDDPPSITVKEQLHDIPARYAFVKDRCQQGRHVNPFFTSLLKLQCLAGCVARMSRYVGRDSCCTAAARGRATSPHACSSYRISLFTTPDEAASTL